MMTRPDRHLLLALLLAACVVVPRAVLISAAHNETIDDDYHLVRGLAFLRRDPGLIHRGLNDPPLGAALAAIPLWLMGGTTHGADEGTALHAQSAYTPERALSDVIEEVEKAYIESALEYHGWNIAKTARELQIGPNRLRDRMKRYDLLEDGPGGAD